MVKKDFIEKITRETGLNRTIVRLVVERFLDETREALLRCERIEIRNFGVFTPKKTAPKVGRNLKTGESIPIGERWKVTFRASRYFKRLNEES